jgi:hypothetical protein
MGSGPVALIIRVRSLAQTSPTQEAGRVSEGTSARLGGEGTKTGSCEGQRPVSTMMKEGIAVSVMDPAPEGVAHR